MLDDISTIRNYSLAMPPRAEQVAIVDHIHASTGNFECTIADAQREISLLREYRTGLIADVVTGKLDVRAAAAALPDEVEEPEPELDEAEDDLDDTDDPTDEESDE